MGEIIKIRNCKILSAGILLVFTIGTTACNSGNGEQVYFHNSDAFIENHTSGILDYESISYEEYAGAGVMSMGPHEPLYRGVICLDEQYAREILENYEWEETDFENHGDGPRGFPTQSWRILKNGLLVFSPGI